MNFRVGFLVVDVHFKGTIAHRMMENYVDR